MKNKLLTGLLSLAIAVGIWLYVVTVVSPNSDKIFYNVPVATQSEALLHDRGLMITETDVTTVSLHLEGNRTDLNKLSNSNIIVTVDVSKIGEAGYHSLPYNISYPGNIAQNAVTTLSKTPGVITVKVEERISKPVPVNVVYSGQLVDNFMADKENRVLDVETVSVTGPKSVVDQITMAKIDVDLTGRSESLSERFTYTLCNDQEEPVDAKLVTTDVADIALTLKIMRVKEISLVVKIVEGGGATAETSKITIEPKTIWVSGSDTLLENIESLEIGTIELAEIPEDQTLTFPIKLPEGITDETGVTEVTVSVEFPELATKTLTVTQIDAVNIPSGMRVDLLTKALEIQVRGPKDQIESLEASDFAVTADFSDVEAGTAKVKADITSSVEGVGAVLSYYVSATVRNR